MSSFNECFTTIFDSGTLCDHEAEISIKGKTYMDGFSHEFGFKEERGMDIDEVGIVLFRENKTPVNINYNKLRGAHRRAIDKEIDRFTE